MAAETPHIDPYLLELQLGAFRSFVQEKSGLEFLSFAANPYTLKQEGYKYDVHGEAMKALDFGSWSATDIGTGRICDATIAAIEIKKSNLVAWYGRYGEASRPQQPLYEARANPARLANVEGVLFHLYRGNDDAYSFGRLVEILGKKYPIVAYLFFLKDRNRYLPIAPDHFDQAWELLGVEFVSSHRCSWENYLAYLALMRELRDLLAAELNVEVALLDAHSFAWILISQMQDQTADLKEYRSLSETERKALRMARIGQGRFRDALITYWTRCAVTGCSEKDLLRASHIKPWSKGTVEERLGLYNGLLLAANIDAAFDAGFVSFDDEGKILISKRLSNDDAEALGIHSEMRLRRIEDGHRRNLAYHRRECFERVTAGQ